MAKIGGLGKGVQALIEDISGPETNAELEKQTITLVDIEPDPNQPRKHFNDESLDELADSIRENGVLQPILVRPNPIGSSASYKIISGERRWRASRLAGLREIPAVVREATDAEARVFGLIENLQRDDLNPVDEAQSIRDLMDEAGLTQEEVAKRLSKKRSTIANSLRLLRLPEDLQNLVKDGKLNTGHAKAILSLPSAELQQQAARMIMKDGLNDRAAESLVKKLQQEPKKSKKMSSRPTEAVEVEEALQKVLGTEVHVDYKDGKGKLSVGFYSEEQLQAFANLLGKYDPEK